MELREVVALMLKEKHKWWTHKCESTDAKHNDGIACMSVEVSVMEMEQRSSKNKYTGKLFINFLSAVSKNALNAIRKEVRGWKIKDQTSKSIEELASIFNPIIRGWNNYYGKFYPSKLQVIHEYINARLIKWVGRKYIKLRGHQRKCGEWLEKVAKQKPNLFIHWKHGAGIFGFE